MAADWNDIKNHIISIMLASKGHTIYLWNGMRYMIEKFLSFLDFFRFVDKIKGIFFVIVCQWKIYGRKWRDVNEHNELVPSGNMEGNRS